MTCLIAVPTTVAAGTDILGRKAQIERRLIVQEFQKAERRRELERRIRESQRR